MTAKAALRVVAVPKLLLLCAESYGTYLQLFSCARKRHYQGQVLNNALEMGFGKHFC